MLKKLLFIFLSATSFSAFALGTENTNAKIQTALDQDRVQHNVPAMQVSVSLPGEYAARNFVSGTTKLNGKINVTTDSLFQMGSITKSFVAVIILKLEAEGKLNLNDPIDKYIDFSKHPTWPIEWQNITIKQLLNMTSGIYGYMDDNPKFMIEILQHPKSHWTANQLINIAAAHPDNFAPGKGWRYSNTNYLLASKIIENITGESVTQIMQEKILGPKHLNLLNTFYAGSHNYPRDVLRRAVDTYAELPNTNIIKNESSPGLSWANAAGCMLSTTPDMIRWVRALFSGQVLPPQQLHEMKSLVCVAAQDNCVPGQPIQSNSEQNTVGFGLGLIEENNLIPGSGLGKIWWYEGGTLGQTFIYVWIPSYNTVISVSANYTNWNSSYDVVGRLMLKIFAILNTSEALKNYRESHGMPTLNASQLKQLQSTLKFQRKMN